MSLGGKMGRQVRLRLALRSVDEIFEEWTDTYPQVWMLLLLWLEISCCRICGYDPVPNCGKWVDKVFYQIEMRKGYVMGLYGFTHFRPERSVPVVFWSNATETGLNLNLATRWFSFWNWQGCSNSQLKNKKKFSQSSQILANTNWYDILFAHNIDSLF